MTTTPHRSTGALSPRLLRCFVTLADELHFGRAADRLYVAQPALSRSIQQLEQQIDHRLFVRTTRSVALTASGLALLPAAREALDALDAVERDLAAARGVLRVAHVPCSDTVAAILDRFARSHPDVEVVERTLDPDEQLAALLVGELDVALARVDDDLDPSLRARLVRQDPLLVAVLGREPGDDRPVDVRLRHLAVPVDGDLSFEAFVEQYELEAGFSATRVHVAPGSGTDTFSVRRAGFSAFLTLASRGVRFDGRWSAVAASPMHAYYPWSVVRRRRDRSPAVQAFVDTASVASAELGWTDLDRLPGTPWLPEGATDKPIAVAA